MQDSRLYFPTWAATQINKGNTIDIMDERIANKADIEEVRRAAMVSFCAFKWMRMNDRAWLKLFGYWKTNQRVTWNNMRGPSKPLSMIIVTSRNSY
ncbi:hypothetical protein SUGI_0664750 [Cryptomeria japonica]|nr:hypothetical protein SUGI_0664750 [Cryptomeria japonica]